MEFWASRERHEEMYCNLTYHLKDTLEQHNPSSQKALYRSCFVLQQLQTGQNPKAEPTTQKEKNFRSLSSILFFF